MQPSNLLRATAFTACLVLSTGTAFAAHGGGGAFGGGGFGHGGFSHGLAGGFYGAWYWYDPYWGYEECDYPYAYGYAEQCYYGLEYPGYAYGYEYPDGQYYGHHRRMHAYEKRRGRAAKKKLSRLQGAPLGRRTRSIDFY